MTAQHPLAVALDEFGAGYIHAGQSAGRSYITNGKVLVVWDTVRDDVVPEGKLVAVEKVIKPEPPGAPPADLAALLAWCGGPRKKEECNACEGTGIEDGFTNEHYFCADCDSENIEKRCPDCDEGMIREGHRVGDILVGDETCAVDQLLLRAALSAFPEGTARIVPYPLSGSNGIVLYGDGWQMYVAANTGEPEGEAFEAGR